MRGLAFCAFCAFCACSALAAVTDSHIPQITPEHFRQWALQHKKAYLDDPQELARRYSIWSANVARIAAHQAAVAKQGSRSSLRLGVNAHTDLTADEFRARYLGAVPMTPPTQQEQQLQQQGQAHAPSWFAGWPRSILRRFGWQSGRAMNHAAATVSSSASRLPAAPALSGGSLGSNGHWRFENVTPPAAVDWRGHTPPVLGAIKDQHVNGTPCGSCWAFSAVSIMEIASAMATGHVVLGSEQQLIDCDTKYDHGCSGGGWLNAIQYTIKNKGLATEKQYPYTGKDGTCNKPLASAKHHKLRVDSWEDVPFSNETALQQAVSRTPVIVAICAGPALDLWHAYAGGIFDAPCCEKEEEVALDHGIVVVGYGTEAGVPYWILKNSWGTSWGENGFMRISRNYGKTGKCALASYPAMVFRKPLPDQWPDQMPKAMEAVAVAAS